MCEQCVEAAHMGVMEQGAHTFGRVENLTVRLRSRYKLECVTGLTFSPPEHTLRKRGSKMKESNESFNAWNHLMLNISFFSKLFGKKYSINLSSELLILVSSQFQMFTANNLITTN